MRSRDLYSDCLTAKNMFGEFVEQKKLAEAKIIWFACLSMLRAIGHVLDKIDSESRSELFKDELKARYKSWKKDPIFKDFMDSERNSILKEYTSTLVEEEKKLTGPLFLDGEPLYLDGEPLFLSSTVTELVKTGVYDKQTPVHILNEALEWWNKELSALEKIF